MQIAQGHWQRHIWQGMSEFNGVENPMRHLMGKAASYEGRYQESFDHMIRRAIDQGWVIEKTLGPRGGNWSAFYKAHIGSFGALVIRDHDGKLLEVKHPHPENPNLYVWKEHHG